MDAQGRPPVVPLLLFLFLFQIIAPGLAFEVRAQTSDYDVKGVVITEVLPYARGGGQETEYVEVNNTGSSNIDMSGWKLCDEHHCIRIGIGEGICSVLEPHDSLTMAQNATAFLNMKQFPPKFAVDDWPKSLCRLDNSSLWPAMLNDGDYIFLEDSSGKIRDAVAFGRDYQGPGWMGGPASAPRMGWTFVREYRLEGTTRIYQDTNSSADWPAYRERRAELQSSPPFEQKSSASLTAMRFPEDGAVLANLLKGSSSEILLNTYEFTSFSMGKLISDRAKAGVKVQIIIEGHPVGGMQQSEVNVLRMLMESGCDVRLIWSNSSQDQYYPFGLDHAKYMVLDKDTTVVMSENLVASALGTVDGSGNRGWGFAIKENSTADHLKVIFYNDWERAIEASKVLAKGAANWTHPPTERPLVPVSPSKGTTFDGAANITMMVSPDTTEDLLLGIINRTHERLYIEMLQFDLDWHLQSGVQETQTSPLLGAIVDAARRGVDVKVLVDSNYLDSNDNGKVVDYVNEVGNSEGLKLQARLASIPNITLVHNKGIIADDVVVAASINWGSSAVRDNREIGLAVQMKGLDALYVSYFMKDWDPKASVPNDGPAPKPGQTTSAYYVCGGLLAVVACGLIIIALTRGRHR